MTYFNDNSEYSINDNDKITINNDNKVIQFFACNAQIYTLRKSMHTNILRQIAIKGEKKSNTVVNRSVHLIIEGFDPKNNWLLLK